MLRRWRQRDIGLYNFVVTGDTPPPVLEPVERALDAVRQLASVPVNAHSASVAPIVSSNATSG
ncbi:hypothetical protein AA0311_1473 [Asaia bogorensis NBRC 16594]|nr:hypothetical protein AA0311_1473 [Asaia bogorensis NBRC 16594]